MTARRQYTDDQLRAWLEYATPHEFEAIDAVLTHGQCKAAAAALGLDPRTLDCRLRTARNRYRRMQLGAAAPPAGYVPTRIATDGEGRVRAVRSRPEGTEAHAPVRPLGHYTKGVSTLLDSAGEVTAQWVKTDQRKVDQWRAYADAVAALCAHVAPAAPTPRPVWADADLCTVLPWGDPHIGMLAWPTETGGAAWDLRIAEQITDDVLGDLITRTPRSAVFVLADLGDLFHAEDDNQLTPHGKNKLDVDSRAAKISRVALRVTRTAVDLGLNHHDTVHVRLMRGNHDPYKCLALGMWLEAIYANEPRVVIQPYENPYQFWQWGQCSFMWHHGDGNKPQAMPEIFAVDAAWGSPDQHRYVHTGHIHSQHRWDFRGCQVESFRTLCPEDYWAHWRGYRSRRTLDAITYHRTHGEISRVQRGVRSLTGGAP